jgi:TetR/AcrR family transcriptional regulator, regulator of cefoperazone and chloramphenicol sensitivity
VPETAAAVRRARAGDLTARSRVRDAALALFAERGQAGTTIRDVAQRAGVSVGLVQHHFGTKAALRAACDDYVLGEIIRVKEALVLEGKIDNPAFLADAHPEILGLYRYLARSLMDGSPAAAEMFEHMVSATETWIATHHPGDVEDVHGYAAVMVAMESGLLAMHGPLSSALGHDVLSAEGHLRLARAKVEFYSTPLVGPELATRMLATIDALVARTREGRVGRDLAGDGRGRR